MSDQKHNDKVVIKINSTEYKLEQPTATGAELKALAGAPDGYWLFQVVPNGEDERIEDTQTVVLHSGQKFRVINPGTAGADVPVHIQTDVDSLKTERGLDMDVAIDSNGTAHLSIMNYPLTEGLFNKPTTNLLIQILPTYPNSKLDMFWVDPDLVYADGAIPQSAECIELYLGKNWRRFSRHLANWNPAYDSLSTYMANVDHWLSNRAMI